MATIEAGSTIFAVSSAENAVLAFNAACSLLMSAALAVFTLLTPAASVAAPTVILRTVTLVTSLMAPIAATSGSVVVIVASIASEAFGVKYASSVPAAG